MRANGLVAIHTVEESKAVLIKSKHPSDPKLVDKIASRIRGVIGKILSSSTEKNANLMGLSCPTIRPLSIQHPSKSTRHGHQNYTRQTGANCYTARWGRLGGGKQHGGEEEDCDRDG